MIVLSCNSELFCLLSVVHFGNLSIILKPVGTVDIEDDAILEKKAVSHVKCVMPDRPNSYGQIQGNNFQINSTKALEFFTTFYNFFHSVFTSLGIWMVDFKFTFAYVRNIAF